MVAVCQKPEPVRNQGLICPNNNIIFFCLLFCLLLTYGNSLKSDWLFDDGPNIVENQAVHLKSLDKESLKKTFYGFRQDKIYRPIAYLSFGLNYYLGGLDPFGYRITNLIIHYLTAIFLFLFVYRTLKLPRLFASYGRSSYPIALLTTFLWATNPVQVTAVTCIVQRMTSMAGLFYILSMYLYLLGRTTDIPSKRFVFLLFSTVSAALSMGTKENAFMIPVSIYLYDLILIQDLNKGKIFRNLKYVIIPTSILALLWLVFFFDILSIAASYSPRPFTLTERLLTEPRVILFYISLLLYPTFGRLMLNHDLTISRSLIDPWTTGPAILTIFACIGLAVWLARKKPLIAYCIAFFFLNHLIEGSFIPLELVFEHRNYVPSMLFFVPFSILIINCLNYFSYKKTLQWMIAGLIIFILFAQGHTVFMYNRLFKDPYLLWTDNTQKAPNLSRPYNNVGTALWNKGLFDEALEEFKKAYELNRYDHPSIKSVTIKNIGLYYFLINEYKTAMAYFFEALKIEPDFANVHLLLAESMVSMHQLEDAEKTTRHALGRWPNDDQFHALLSLILLKQGLYDKAIKKAWETLNLDHENSVAMRVLGEAYRQKGQYERATSFWERYLFEYKNGLEGNLALIDLYAKTHETEKLDRAIANVMLIKKSKSWNDLIKQYQNDLAAHAFQPDPQKLLSVIRARLKNQP